MGGHDNIFGLPVAKRAVSNDDKEWDAVSATGIVSDAKDMGNVLSMYLAAGGQTLSYDQIEKIYSDGVDCGKTIFGTNGTSSLGWIKTKVGKQDVYYVSGAIDGYISAAFLVPGQDVGIAMLFDTSDVISGNDVISELMSNVVCLAIGEKARTIDSKAVMMPHIEFDVVYVIAFFASLLPMFMMSWWYRRTRNKGIGIVKTIVDVVVHIALPIVIYQFVPVIIENVLGNSLGSWFMIKKFLPECYYITLIVDAILLIGVPVKVIAAIVAMKKGPVDEDEEMAEDELFENLGDDAEKSDEDKEEKTEQITSDDVKQQESDETSEKSEKNEDENLDGSNDIADKDGKTITDISETEQGVSDDDNAEISDSKQDISELENVTEEIAAAAEEDDDIENVETKNDISETESQDEQADALKTQDEVVKEFKTRSGKNKKTEEYESSFEREAVKALETDEHENSDDTNDELKDIKSDSQMQTAVPKIKKRYSPQKGMPVKIVVEPDDNLDN